jgi:hypothetical protein
VGFSGADIASAVRQLGFDAIRSGDDKLTMPDYHRAFGAVVPLSQSSPERIREVRELASRAIPASRPH